MVYFVMRICSARARVAPILKWTAEIGSPYSEDSKGQAVERKQESDLQTESSQQSIIRLRSTATGY